MEPLDAVIVGAGIAGLYTAHVLLKKNPEMRFVILEKSEEIGGRVGVATFAGHKVTCGAGVGRLGRDKLLTALLKELGVEYNTGKVKRSFASGGSELELKSYLRQLQDAPGATGSVTFKKFATRVLGSKAAYARFVMLTGYTDFDNMSAHDALTDYEFKYTMSGWTAMYIPWQELLDKLVARIGRRNILLKKEVKDIDWDKSQTTIKCADGTSYTAPRVIVATTADALKALFPKHKPFQQIHGQPFLRLYAQIAKECRKAVEAVVAPHTVCVVGNLIEKIIPIDPDNGVYMIAYTDNQNARDLW